MINDNLYGPASQENLIFQREPAANNITIFNALDYLQTTKEFSKENEAIGFLTDVLSRYKEDRDHTVRANVIKNTACFTCLRFRDKRFHSHLLELLILISIAGQWMMEGSYDRTKFSEHDVNLALSWFKVLDEDRRHNARSILAVEKLSHQVKQAERYSDEFYSLLHYLDDVLEGTLNAADDLFVFVLNCQPKNEELIHIHFEIANILSLHNSHHIPKELVYLCRLIEAVFVSTDKYESALESVLYDLFIYFKKEIT